MTDIALSQPLHERVYERIRDSIGDLMTDEDLKILVDKATEKAFFQERGTGSYNDKLRPSLFMEMMEKEMQPLIATALKEWMANNSELVAKTLTDVLEQGAAKMMMRGFDSMLYSAFSDFETRLRSSLIQR